MCVCAAGTGAAIVPVSHAVKQHFAPKRAVHRVARPAEVAGPALASTSDCLPAASLRGPDLGDGTTGGIQALNGPVLPPIAGTEGGLTPVQFGSGDGGGGGGGGFGPGTPGGGGGTPGGGTPGGGTPGGGTPGTGLPPISSNAPEPTSWALMISGFGLVGAAMRYRIVART
jgi:hypothetical protein